MKTIKLMGVLATSSIVLVGCGGANKPVEVSSLATTSSSTATGTPSVPTLASSSSVAMGSSSSVSSQFNPVGTSSVSSTSSVPGSSAVTTSSVATSSSVSSLESDFIAWGSCTGNYASNRVNTYSPGGFASPTGGSQSYSSSSAFYSSSSYSYSSAMASTSTAASASMAPIASSSSFASSSRPNEDIIDPTVGPDVSADATEFYFSYDESDSTASRDLTLQSIFAGNTYLDPSWGRPYEFLNAETFPHFNAEDAAPFNVSIGLYVTAPGEVPVGPQYQGDLYTFGINVSGPELTKEARPNVVLTVLLDVSGSMSSPYGGYTLTAPSNLLDVAQHGLYRLLDSLKEGDVVNLVTFETNAQVVIQGWQYGDADCDLVNAITSLYTMGSTNLDEGIRFAYRAAQETYDPSKANRVVMLTDAYANTGQTNVDIIAQNTVINGLEGIYFSGIGIGQSFNEAFLNELTEIGKGTYSAMITPSDAERIMTQNFTRFIDYAVANVRFKIRFPDSLNQLESSAENISTESSAVSKINFSYNSDQFFLESFSGIAEGEDQIDFMIYFDDENGAEQEVVLSHSVEELIRQGGDEIKSALAVSKLAQIVAGELSCSEVINSGLLNQEVNSEIYATYTLAIETLCSVE